MSRYNLEHPKKEVRGIIVFLSESDDPRTEPWYGFRKAGNNGLRVLYLDNILSRLSDGAPNHILLSAFFPLVCSDLEQLKTEAPNHYQRIRQEPIDEDERDSIIETFLSWMMARIKNREEVEAMITRIPTLKGSAAAAYFEESGELKGGLRQLNAFRDEGIISEEDYLRRARPLLEELKRLNKK